MGKSVRNTNPFVLTPDDVSGKDTTQPSPKNPANPFLLTPEDARFKKKKQGGSESADTSSPSPFQSPSPSAEQINNAAQNLAAGKASVADINTIAQTDYGKNKGLANMDEPQKQVYVDAVNGKKKSAVVNSAIGIINTFYPRTGDPNKDKVREKIMQSIEKGDQDTIIKTRDSIVNSLQKKIDEISPPPEGGGSGEMYEMMKSYRKETDPKIKGQIAQINQQIQDVRQVMDEYGKVALINSPDIKAWITLDETHPQMKTSIAASKLGEELERRYGIVKTTPNKRYEHLRAGFGELINNLRMDINELIAKGMPSKNMERLGEAAKKIDLLNRYVDQYGKLDTEQFPDVGMSNTARIIGDVISKTNPNKLIISKQDVLDAAQVQEKETPGFLSKYGKFVTDVAASESGSILGGVEPGYV